LKIYWKIASHQKGKKGEIDNRASHFYLALFWAQELAKQTDDALFKSDFEIIFQKLKANESDIISELSTSDLGVSDIDGYYYPNSELITKSMRPSSLLNNIIDSI